MCVRGCRVGGGGGGGGGGGWGEGGGGGGGVVSLMGGGGGRRVFNATSATPSRNGSQMAAPETDDH